MHKIQEHITDNTEIKTCKSIFQFRLRQKKYRSAKVIIILQKCKIKDPVILSPVQCLAGRPQRLTQERCRVSVSVAPHVQPFDFIQERPTSPPPPPPPPPPPAAAAAPLSVVLWLLPRRWCLLVVGGWQAAVQAEWKTLRFLGPEWVDDVGDAGWLNATCTTLKSDSGWAAVAVIRRQVAGKRCSGEHYMRKYNVDYR